MNDNLVISSENVGMPKLNVIQRIMSTFFSPGKLMGDLERKPRVLLGIILSVITPMLMMFGVFPMFKEYTRTVLENTYANMGTQLTPEMFEQILNVSVITGPIGAGVGAGIMLLVEALVLWLVLKIFKGQSSFKQCLSVLGYSNIIALLGTIVFVIAVQFSGTYSDVAYTSLASLIPDMKGSFLFGIARNFEVFAIWQYIVAAIGMATISKIDNKKVYIVMAVVFLALACFAGYSEVASAKLLN